MHKPPSPPLLMVYFQQMPPFPGGTAMRGESIVPYLAQYWRERMGDTAITEVLTTVGICPDSRFLKYTVVSGSVVRNSSNLIVRLIGELVIGTQTAFQVLTKRPRAVFLSSPGYWPCIIISLVCRLRSIPYVLDVRDLYPEVYLHAKLIKINSYAYRTLQKLTSWWYRNATAIALATHGLKEIVRHQCVRSNGSSPNIEVVYNGFPSYLFNIRQPKLPRFTVVFHGILGYFQDVESLCALAKLLQPHQVDVVVIGYGKKEQLVRNCKTPNLIYLGRLGHLQTMNFVAQCHLGLCLRLDEGISKDAFPVKVWECLGLCIPSIVTPICEAGDFLVNHGCGLQFNSGDLDVLLETILNLRARPELLSDMAKCCNEAANAFTREKMGQMMSAFAMSSLLGPELAPERLR